MSTRKGARKIGAFSDTERREASAMYVITETEPWRSGHILEICADGFGYIVDDLSPEQSYPFSISTLSKPTKPELLEGAAVRYLVQEQKVAEVQLCLGKTLEN